VARCCRCTRIAGLTVLDPPANAKIRPLAPATPTTLRLGSHASAWLNVQEPTSAARTIPIGPRQRLAQTRSGSGRRHLGQDLVARRQALVDDPSLLAELPARRRRQPTGDHAAQLPGPLAAEAAPYQRRPKLTPIVGRGSVSAVVDKQNAARQPLAVPQQLPAVKMTPCSWRSCMATNASCHPFVDARGARTGSPCCRSCSTVGACGDQVRSMSASTMASLMSGCLVAVSSVRGRSLASARKCCSAAARWGCASSAR
jgi:hypothetical protein